MDEKEHTKPSNPRCQCIHGLSSSSCYPVYYLSSSQQKRKTPLWTKQFWAAEGTLTWLNHPDSAGAKLIIEAGLVISDQPNQEVQITRVGTMEVSGTLGDLRSLSSSQWSQRRRPGLIKHPAMDHRDHARSSHTRDCRLMSFRDRIENPLQSHWPQNWKKTKKNVSV